MQGCCNPLYIPKQFNAAFVDCCNITGATKLYRGTSDQEFYIFLYSRFKHDSFELSFYNIGSNSFIKFKFKIQ